VELVLEHRTDVDEVERILRPLAVGELQIERANRRLIAPVTGGAATLMEVLRQVEQAQVRVLDFGLRRPTLDDVFLTLTGRAAAPAESDADTDAGGSDGRNEPADTGANSAAVSG
jgi:ABC-2 type transport system ATP-binding protein